MTHDHVTEPVPRLDTEDRMVYIQQMTQYLNPDITSISVIEMTYSEALVLADWINEYLAIERQ